MKQHKAGRKPKPKAQKWRERVFVNMTTAERKMLEAAARRAGVSISVLLMRPWRKES
ncbi:MAG: hypothetical protein NTW87_06320 [Planctomycetota bacterium]|nr:hypothetical protein [Planctomycetota bacterium]